MDQTKPVKLSAEQLKLLAEAEKELKASGVTYTSEEVKEYARKRVQTWLKNESA